MSWWNPISWFDDDKPAAPKKPSPLERERESWGTEPSPEILRRHNVPARQPDAVAVRNGAAPALASWADPLKASQPTQRYLRAAGWKGAPSQLQPFNIDLLDQGTLQDYGAHRYRLTPWQQEQARLEYGVEMPKDSPELTGDVYRSGRMNASDYESLNDKQKKAMRFNEMLMAAVEGDRRSAVAPEEQDSGYRDRVAEMFGTQGGSDVYAPRTMALLDKMGMGRLRGQDLDEYLSLDRAYDMNEVAALQPWDITPEVPKYENFAQARTTDVESILDMRQIDLAGGLIEKALADTSVTGWNEDARIAQYLGNRPPVEEIPFGWLQEGELRGSDEDAMKEGFYQDWWNNFQNREMENLDYFWADVDKLQVDQPDLDLFYDFIYNKSLEADRVGQTDPQYRTGAEVRQFLGLGG